MISNVRFQIFQCQNFRFWNFKEPDLIISHVRIHNFTYQISEFYLSDFRFSNVSFQNFTCQIPESHISDSWISYVRFQNFISQISEFPKLRNSSRFQNFTCHILKFHISYSGISDFNCWIMLQISTKKARKFKKSPFFLELWHALKMTH